MCVHSARYASASCALLIYTKLQMKMFVHLFDHQIVVSVFLTCMTVFF